MAEHSKVTVDERQEANENMEFFMTLGVEQTEARCAVAELYFPPRIAFQIGKFPLLKLALEDAFDIREDKYGRI